MTSPSAINGSKHLGHDEIHLWLSDPENMMLVIESVHNIKREEIATNILETTIEFPVYSSGRYLVGVCDCLVDYQLANNKYALIIEIKPTLGSVSGIIGQTRVYVDCISDVYYNKRRKQSIAELRTLILTYDKVTKFDCLFKKAGFHIYRIPK